MKKNKMAILISMILLVVLVFAGCSAQPNIIVDPDGLYKETIYVEGQGEVSVAPDVAYLTVSIITEDKDAKVAQEKNKEVMTEVQKKLNELGIKNEDIETLYYNISEIRDYRNEVTDMAISVDSLPYPVAGYQVSNTIKITIKDINNVGNVIDTITVNKYMTISNLSFGLSDETKAKEAAIKLAVEDAKNKANAIANSFNISIKEVSKVTLNDYNSIGLRAEMASFDASAKALTPINKSSIKVSVRVSVEFSIK